METNEFLLYNDVICRIHACRTERELRSVLLVRLKLIIPYSYASIISIWKNEETEEITHGEVFCRPPEFEAFERSWLAQIDRAYTLWLSHAVDSVVVRGSEDADHLHHRFRDIHKPYDIIDDLEVNITYRGKILGRLALYRTQADGCFTEQEAFYLRALSIHINQAFWNCLLNQMEGKPDARRQAELARKFSLTRREEEVFALAFQDLSNEEMARQLCVSKNTLLKHLQNIYRKCGVTSRWELSKLGE